MTALFIASYDVSDPERFAEYNPGSVPQILATVAKHGGEAIAAGPPEAMVGTTTAVVVAITFPDADAAKAWLNDPEYAPLKAIRHESTTNISEYIVPPLG